MSDFWKGYNIDNQGEDWLRESLREIVRKYGKEVGYSASLDDVVERRSTTTERRNIVMGRRKGQ